jgi:uncharacterized membrane protein YagU involved in acid resistance
MARIHLLRGMAAGLLAGCAAAYIMNQFQELRPIRKPQYTGGPSPEPEHHQEPLQGTSEEEDATVKTAQRISQRVLHHNLTESEKKVAGPAVHYMYGSLIGAVYGGLSELLPIVSAGLGLPFGFFVWLVGDEVAVPVLGLGKGPLDTPPEKHADALAAHFMYGAALDLLRRVFKVLI